MKRYQIKKYLIYATALILSFAVGGSAAFAQANTVIDKSTYVQADSFVNAPITLETVKVGLDYGSNGVELASFINHSGEGFLLGHHDNDRSFYSFLQTDSDDISVKLNPADSGSWSILLNKKYSNYVRAYVLSKVLGGYTEEQDGIWRVYYGAFDSMADCRSAIDAAGTKGTPFCKGSFCITVMDNRDDTVIFSTEYGENSISFAPVDGENALTDYSEESYHGSFRLDAASNGLTVINYVDIETYVKGVIPYEMSSSWPLEALKAQAICARTYAVYNENGYEHYGFDLTDDTYSQVYRGVLRANESTDAAVNSTAGLVVRYEGEICQIYYSASDGGATESGVNVFDVELPYLKGIYDPFEDSVNYDIKDWQFKKTGEEIGTVLRDSDFDIGDVTNIEPSLSETGNVIALRFSDKEGKTVDIAGRRCYNILGLYSCRFSIDKEGETFIFNGDGWGHNCGMSQYGAKAMAGVYGYNCDDIIRFYFTGAYIA